MLYELKAGHAIFFNTCDVFLIGVMQEHDMSNFLLEGNASPQHEELFKQRLGTIYGTYTMIIDKALKATERLRKTLKLDARYTVCTFMNYALGGLSHLVLLRSVIIDLSLL